MIALDGALALVAIDIALAKKLGLLVFFAMFVGVAVWLLVTRPERFRLAAQLPLEDESILTPRTGRSASASAARDVPGGSTPRRGSATASSSSRVGRNADSSPITTSESRLGAPEPPEPSTAPDSRQRKES